MDGYVQLCWQSLKRRSIAERAQLRSREVFLTAQLSVENLNANKLKGEEVNKARVAYVIVCDL
jgi:hypothetical protein